jgi:hypothetical protein
MDILHLVPILIAAIMGIAKAASERVMDFFHWNNSIWALKYPHDITLEKLWSAVSVAGGDKLESGAKFTHPREVSWVRKHAAKNKIIRKLTQTILVGTTDLWHFGDWVFSIGAFLAIPAILYFLPTTPLWLFATMMVAAYAIYAATFHIFFHKLFYLKVSPVNRPNPATKEKIN